MMMVNHLHILCSFFFVFKCCLILWSHPLILVKVLWMWRMVPFYICQEAFGTVVAKSLLLVYSNLFATLILNRIPLGCLNLYVSFRTHSLTHSLTYSLTHLDEHQPLRPWIREMKNDPQEPDHFLSETLQVDLISHLFIQLVSNLSGVELSILQTRIISNMPRLIKTFHAVIKT